MTPKTEDLPLLLAGVRMACIDSGCMMSPDSHKRVNSPCQDGLVYLFPDDSGVRVLCVQLNWPICQNKNCEDCQGRGWTASEDGWVWWRASYQALADRWDDFMDSRLVEWIGVSKDPQVAFFTKLMKYVDAIPGVVWPDV